MDVQELRKDFPILSTQRNGHQLVFLDNTATTQKPRQVIDAISNVYLTMNANVHRGAYTLSQEMTDAFEAGREKVARFLNAENEEIIFTRNATEALNLVAYAWAANELKPGDEIITTIMEHHSDIVPWQALEQKGIVLKYVEVTPEGILKIEQYKELITPKTRLVCATQASNTLGTINPVKEIAKLAHEAGALFLVDGAQSVPHMPVNVKDIDCDFLAFSGHKMLGPTGSGALYAKRELLLKMQPFLRGGDMIKEVHLHETVYNDLPWKFEAGTPDYVSAVALGTAIDYLNKVGMHNIRAHEVQLTKYALKRVSEVKGIRIYGPMDAEKKGGVVTFNVGDVHPHDVASILDEKNITVRTGHHCNMPLWEFYKVDATARASFYLYNTEEEVDKLVDGLGDVAKVFKI